jgi:adenylate cyclase
MSQAVDILSEHGAKRRVQDVERWLRSAGLPQLTRLALERHFPDFIADQIAEGVLALPPAKRQQATILFSDVRGFTTLAERLEPEGVVELLNEWLTEATRAIRRNGGFVDKFVGDAVMAVFGISQEAANPGSQAVQAALEMSESLWAMNLRHQTIGKPELRIGIGIASGDVVVGFIGSHLRQTYTAIGDAVNIASRLETETKNYPGCEIFITEDVERMQRDDRIAESRFVGNLALKGKWAKVPTYELLGRRGSSAADSRS